MFPKVTEAERERFIEAARSRPGPERTFLLLLTFAGCRISEALQLTVGRVELDEQLVTFASLKKKRRGVYRRFPLPPHILDALDMVHGLRQRQRSSKESRQLLWSFSRSTAWRLVKACMHDAEVFGPQATPKGLRHGFGVRAATSGVPLSSLQVWLGHAHLSTTAIYEQAVGDEERKLAEKMW